MFTKTLYGIGFAALLFVLVGLFLPREVHVERQVAIERPAITVFTLLNGYRSFLAWSPWAGRDPDAVYELSGPATGVGARLSWEGDPRLVGSGWQEITEVQPNEWVRSKLNFDLQSAADTWFRIDETAGGALVTWGFDSDLVSGQGFVGGLLARYFGLFFDRWIGTDYERGLVKLKTYAESLPAADFSDLEVELLHAEPLDILYVSSDNSANPGDVAESLAAAYREITTFMLDNELEIRAQPMAITRAWDEKGYRFDAAVPVVMRDVPLTGRIRFGKSPSGPALRAIHRGPYETMTPTYEKIDAFMAAHGLEEGRVSWEHYVVNPGATPPEDWVTHIYFLLSNASSGVPEP
ncbi:MAG: GyrI-like domain-containing protein [Xanthomonadales bacterium]|nr:GyrI-like domain-containing protein [Xanthomonadales bacterium]